MVQTSRWLQNKSSVLAWPGHAKAELLFWSHREVLHKVMCHPVLYKVLYCTSSRQRLTLLKSLTASSIWSTSALLILGTERTRGAFFWPLVPTLDPLLDTIIPAAPPLVVVLFEEGGLRRWGSNRVLAKLTLYLYFDISLLLTPHVMRSFRTNTVLQFSLVLMSMLVQLTKMRTEKTQGAEHRMLRSTRRGLIALTTSLVVSFHSVISWLKKHFPKRHVRKKRFLRKRLSNFYLSDRYNSKISIFNKSVSDSCQMGLMTLFYPLKSSFERRSPKPFLASRHLHHNCVVLSSASACWTYTDCLELSSPCQDSFVIGHWAMSSAAQARKDLAAAVPRVESVTISIH